MVVSQEIMHPLDISEVEVPVAFTGCFCPTRPIVANIKNCVVQSTAEAELATRGIAAFVEITPALLRRHTDKQKDLQFPIMFTSGSKTPMIT